jgi:hypothetical protein
MVAILATVSAMPLAGGPTPAVARTSVYTIGSYPVEARARDAVTAKATAIADGQQAALRSLVRRLVPVTAYGRLRDLALPAAADIVDGVAVKRERNSATDYIATLDFAFQPAAVREALRRAGVPFVEEQAPPIMVIPLWRPAAGPVESGRGAWFDAWAGLDLVHALTPVRLEGLKPGLTLDALRPVLDGKAPVGRLLAQPYATDTIVLALAEPDRTGAALVVTLAGQDAVGPFMLRRSYRVVDGDAAYTAELAAVIGLGILEGRWKATRGATAGAEGSGGAIRLLVEFGSLGEWNEMRSRILDADGAYDIEVGAVSPRGAEMMVKHAGGATGLAAALARAGLGMTDGGGTDPRGPTWRVRQTF